MAATHARTSSSLNSVNIARSGGSFDCVYDFALGYCFATADYFAVSGVLFNESFALGVAHMSETHGLFAHGVEVRFFFGCLSFDINILDIFGDCGGRGETG